MNDKALVTLEYNKILERLGEYIASDIGREYAAALRPAHTFSDAETLLSLTDEAYGVYRRQGRTPISAFPDIRGVLRRAHAAYALPAGDAGEDRQGRAAQARQRRRLTNDFA